MEFVPRHTANKPSAHQRRIGDVDVVRTGHDPMVFSDLYVNLLSMSWGGLIFVVALFYLISNLIFAVFYYFFREGLTEVRGFADCFFFSVQTMATIGYGHMSPISPVTHILVTIEALWGFTYFAFVMGLMYAKFSRPTAQVLFSNVAVISNFEGVPHLKIRLANKRNNRIVDVTARMFLLRHSTTKEGFAIRRFYDLKLVRDYMPLLRLTWTLMHPIDADSPFYAMKREDFNEIDDEIFVTLIGLDETLSQDIHARHSWFVDEVLHDTFFEDVVRRNDMSLEIDYGQFHSVRKQPPNGYS
jgi:inward rectifier potassium channel